MLFTGTAGQTAAIKAGIKLTQSGLGSNAVVTINENYPNSVGTSTSSPGPGPAIYLNGDINNLGGQVAIANVDGSVGQLGAINAEQVNVTAPNGIMVISPADGVEITGAGAYSEWAGVILWPGGDPTADNSEAPPKRHHRRRVCGQRGVQLKRPVPSNSDFTGALIGHSGDAAYSTSEVFYGGDMPWVGSIMHDGSQGTAEPTSPVNQTYAISGSAGDNEGYFPDVPVEPLTETASYSQANESAPEAGAIRRGADSHQRQHHRP